MRKGFLVVALLVVMLGATVRPAAAQPPPNVLFGVGVGASMDVERVPSSLDPIGRHLGSRNWVAKFAVGFQVLIG